MITKKAAVIPKAFIWRRIHSLMGLAIVIYLVEHLLTNSQAALWLGDDGIGFIHMVNAIQRLPYLQVIEILFIGVPIAFHGVWGIKYALTAKSNSRKSDGSKPSLTYERNRAYTWQRATSWILLMGIVFHVVQMRFVDKPKKVMKGNKNYYLVTLSFDDGLYTLSPRLGVSLYGQNDIKRFSHRAKDYFQSTSFYSDRKDDFDPHIQQEKAEEQIDYEQYKWMRTLGKYQIKKDEVVAAAADPATAILLTTRNTFKSPLMSILYTIFVLSAVFHAANGVWTFLVTWGVILSYRSQKKWVNVCWVFMFILLFWGLAAIWGSYWLNLRH